MTINFEVTISGTPDMEAAISNVFSEMRSDLEGTLVEEGAMIMEASKLIVPHDEGTLQASGGFYGTLDNAEGVFVRIGYGGAASGYAKLQHETPPHIFSHDEGRSWKYLERPVFDAVATMPARLAGSLSGRLAARFGGGGSAGGGTFGGG